ncbi:MAG: AbrB/MazE/SpoVT family DNA-binding domain-containing protein [Spirochaetaceae bacterium]|nr:MAG: AbrB/MazE/SpoVT family DNA-binding domain-containing protein [Spirochaetaceae bacterium]
MVTVTLTQKGQIVIPAKVRQKLNLKKGSRLSLEEQDDKIILKAVNKDYFSKMAGILDTGGKLSVALLKEREHDKKQGA